MPTWLVIVLTIIGGAAALKILHALAIVVVLPITQGAMYTSTGRVKISKALDAVTMKPGGKRYLMAPAPTPVPPEVLAAGAEPVSTTAARTSARSCSARSGGCRRYVALETTSSSSRPRVPVPSSPQW